MTELVPAHVATPYGFWADTMGEPGSHATVGAGHSVVHFGPDGYIDMILVQPASSSGSTTTQYNIPFNPWVYGSRDPSIPLPPPEDTDDGGGEEPPTSGFPECPEGYYFNLWSGRCEPIASGGGSIPPEPPPPPSGDKVARAIALLEEALRTLRS